jgi:hypothetical protein
MICKHIVPFEFSKTGFRKGMKKNFNKKKSKSMYISRTMYNILKLICNKY